MKFLVTLLFLVFIPNTVVLASELALNWKPEPEFAKQTVKRLAGTAGNPRRIESINTG